MRLFIKTLFYIIFDNIIFFYSKIFSKKNKKLNSILFFRLDGIGDYIIFRNFVEALKNDNRYVNTDLELWTNKNNHDLVEYLDNEIYTKVIYIDVNRLTKSLKYRAELIIQASSVQFEMVINSLYSRRYFEEILIKCVQAKIKIGINGDLSNLSNNLRNIISKQYYTKLLNIPDSIVHDFNKNAFFFKKIFDIDIQFSNPKFLNFDLLGNRFISENELIFNQPYVIFFPSASAVHKRWNPEKYSTIAKYIFEVYKYRVIIAGDLSDNKIGNEIIDMTPGADIINMTGKTSLIELALLIANSKLLISNDSCAVHMAIALKKKVIGLFNGQHFGRFSPYPNVAESVFIPIYPFELNDIASLQKSLSGKSPYSVNSISQDTVIECINRII